MRHALAVCALLITTPLHAASVHSRSGITVSVAASAQHALQCVVNYIERAGVKIASMRGYGKGTVRHSLHPSGRALDINQYARGRTRPYISRHLANAAGSACGVVSGGTWNDNDTGHWNVGRTRNEYADDKPSLASGTW